MKRLLMACLVLAMVASAPAEENAPLGGPAADLRFKGYPDAPAFTVVPRKDKLSLYPCSNCHRFMEPNPKPRDLSPPHNAVEFQHGAGRVWCLVCHNPTDRDTLRTQLDEQVDFNDAYLVCGGCHADRQKDWYFGGHGKRVGNWQGERALYNCTHCHNPHEPVIQAREPMPPPPVRAGLERKDGHGHAKQRVWDRYSSELKEASNAH